MGTFLRVLNILLLPLAIACLVLGILLFDRREMLKGRTQKLEATLIKLAPVIELETATLEEKPPHVAMDISPCTSELIETPDTSDFWMTKYKDHLELIDQPKLNLKTKEDELSLYYKLDPIEGKREKTADGYYITEGPGTMQPHLDDIIKRATDQLNRLEETREMMTVLRRELEDTITDLNGIKARLREALNTIVRKDNEIAELRNEIASLNNTIAGLRAEIDQLNDTIREKNRQIDVLTETLADRDLKIKSLEERIRILMIELRNIDRRVAQDGDALGIDTAIVLTQGVKGRIVQVDPKWKFVVLELEQEFIDELTAQSRLDLDLTKLRIAFDVRRPAADGAGYVTRIKLREADVVKRIGVADIMPNWQQMPIKAGDEAYR